MGQVKIYEEQPNYTNHNYINNLHSHTLEKYFFKPVPYQSL